MNSNRILGGLAIEGLALIGERRRAVAGVYTLVMLGFIAAFFLVTPMYSAKTVLLPPQQKLSGLGSLANLSAIADLGSLGMKSPDQTYLGLLQSDELANLVIRSLALQSRWRMKTLIDTRTRLKKNAISEIDKKSNFIVIHATDKDPLFAAKLANEYINQLRRMLNDLAVTDGQQRVVFFERQINETLKSQEKIRADFESAKRKSGFSSLDGQIATDIKVASDLQATLVAKQVQLESLLHFQTEKNPDVERVKSDIQAIQNKILTMQSGLDNQSDSTADVYSGTENVQLYKKIRLQDLALDEYQKQLQLAKLDVAKEGPLVQQIEIASPPEKKAFPKLSTFLILGFLVSSFVSALTIWVALVFDSLKLDAAASDRLSKAWGMPSRKRVN